MVIRSYRDVFDLERRIHRLDRFRVPVPHGIPLRGLAYGIAALLALLLLSELPLLGAALGALPAPLRLVVLPAGVAMLLTQVKVDGRSAHTAAAAWARMALAPKRLVGMAPAPADEALVLGEVAFSPDEHASHYRRAAVLGPARVLLRYPARAHRSGSTLWLDQLEARPMYRGKVVSLRAGQRLVFRRVLAPAEGRS